MKPLNTNEKSVTELESQADMYKSPCIVKNIQLYRTVLMKGIKHVFKEKEILN